MSSPHSFWHVNKIVQFRHILGTRGQGVYVYMYMCIYSAYMNGTMMKKKMSSPHSFWNGYSIGTRGQGGGDGGEGWVGAHDYRCITYRYIQYHHTVLVFSIFSISIFSMSIFRISIYHRYVQLYSVSLHHRSIRHHSSRQPQSPRDGPIRLCPHQPRPNSVCI
jgi:hypothetical protein